MSLMTIDDLPIELLDEIFSYVFPVIYENPIVPINTVCRRWNRPFMTQRLNNHRIPQDIDLQTKFPKLTCFAFWPRANDYKDFSFFKGHPFLKTLEVREAKLLSSVLNCPRLTTLIFTIFTFELFFNDDTLQTFIAVLPQLDRLNFRISPIGQNWDPELIPSYNQKLTKMIQSRPLKLKHLTIECRHVDFSLFCQLFQSSSLDHLDPCTELTAEQTRKCFECFPNIRSLKTYGTSILSYKDINFDNITTLIIFDHRLEDVTLSFAFLMNQFPNVESLEVSDCRIWFDLENPTRLTHSRLLFTGPVVQPRLFSHLKTLHWKFDPNQFNSVMQELGVNCPQLTSIIIELKKGFWEGKNWILPELDNVVFPSLVTFKLEYPDLEFNASLGRFLARHRHLKRIAFFRPVKFEEDWEPIQSDQILWPHLHELIVPYIHDHNYKQEIRDWFMKNAPNVKDLHFESR